MRPAKTQISPHIRAAWSESLLGSLCIAKGLKRLQVDSEDILAYLLRVYKYREAKWKTKFSDYRYSHNFSPAQLNTFMPIRLFYLSSLDESISIIRDVWLLFCVMVDYIYMVDIYIPVLFVTMF